MQPHPLLSFFEINQPGSSPGAHLNLKSSGESPCPQCGTRVSTHSFERPKMTVVGSGKWNDILANLDWLVLHERVVEVMTAEKLTGFKAHLIETEKIENTKLSRSGAPRYYLIEVLGQVSVDWNELDDEGGSVCPSCFTRKAEKNNKYRWKPKRLVPDMGTWDGSDFVKISNYRTNRCYSTKRFVELAHEHHWTNFVFGASLPGVSIFEKPTGDFATYSDPKWFEKTSHAVAKKHPDLCDGMAFEIPGDREGKTDSTENTLPKQVIEDARPYKKRLLDPRFSLLKERIGHEVSKKLIELFRNRDEILRRNFIVNLPVPEETNEEAFFIESYSPIDGTTLDDLSDEVSGFVEFASDGREGLYVIDPEEEDPQVHLFILDGWDLIPFGVRLSEFMVAPRTPTDIE